MSGMDDLSFSLQMRDIVNSLIRDALDQQRPKPRMATVKAIDRANGKCTITYNGETSQVIVNMGTPSPSAIDQWVRVEGIGTDKYITGVVGQSYEQQEIATNQPIAAVSIFAGATAPTGWLLCDGSAVSRTTYQNLFGVIGTAYGAGNGTTTFNLPNLKGRVPVGRDAAQTEFDVLGETGGEKAHTLTTAEMPSHNHSINDPSHSHRQVVTANSGGTAVRNDWSQDGNGGIYDQGAYTAGSTTGISINNTGGGGAHNNLQPYISLNYIIKT